MCRFGQAIALVLVLATAPAAWAQEAQTTFFDREDWDSCGGFVAAETAELAAGPIAGAAWQPRTPAYAAYFNWAEGYLTARAEDGSLRRHAYRPQRAAPAMRTVAAFCRAHPLQSYYSAVIDLAEAMAGHGPAASTLTGAPPAE